MPSNPSMARNQGAGRNGRLFRTWYAVYWTAPFPITLGKGTSFCRGGYVSVGGRDAAAGAEEVA